MDYSRQKILEEIGVEGQKKLAVSTVAIIGVGAIGSVSAELMARAGIGKIIIVDRDIIEQSNLQRQLLYTERDVGSPKAIVSNKRLKEINKDLVIESYSVDLSPENIGVLAEAEVILDCTDNLETRFLLNDYCLKNNKSWVYSAGIKTIATVMPLIPGNACFRCVFGSSKSHETCETEGVLGSTTAIAGSLQVSLAIKILLNTTIKQEMFRFDVWNQDFTKLKLSKKDCLACNGEYEYLDGDKLSKTVKMCGSNTYQIKEDVDFEELKKNFGRFEDAKVTEDFLQYNNITLFSDGRALVKAKNEEEARSLYSKYVGN